MFRLYGISYVQTLDEVSDRTMRADIVAVDRFMLFQMIRQALYVEDSGLASTLRKHLLEVPEVSYIPSLRQLITKLW